MRSTFRGILWAILLVTFTLPAVSQADGVKMGAVVMHGKGGSPNKFVNGLADALAEKGYVVANIEMPWSKNREYDVDTVAADAQIDKAIADLRAKGAQKVFVIGHSQGGAFAIHYASTHKVDGLVPIVPGGNPGSRLFRAKLGKMVNKARKLVEAGKGDEKTNLKDFEGSKGYFSVYTTPKIYLTWFDPEGAMNYGNAIQNISKDLPVLFVEATDDYPGLRKFNMNVYDDLARNKLTRLYEPNASHIGAPDASIGEIEKWTTEVANSAK